MHALAVIQQQLESASRELQIDHKLADLRQIARLARQQWQSQCQEVERLNQAMTGVRWPDPRIQTLEAGLRAAKAECGRLAGLSRRAEQRAHDFQREVWQPLMTGPAHEQQTQQRRLRACHASQARERNEAARRGRPYRSGD
ncbi:hypothetical protein [Chitinimonas sp.]|uniref:hypothetical protein n=1 Tax=Chitinimonas sp. TaxID=1934313 RepID=UPI002F95E5AD